MRFIREHHWIIYFGFGICKSHGEYSLGVYFTSAITHLIIKLRSSARKPPIMALYVIFHSLLFVIRQFNIKHTYHRPYFAPSCPLIT